MVDENRTVYGTTFKFTGYDTEGKDRIETNWIFLLDDERRYYDEVVVDGTPYVDSMNKFSPDRGLVSTYSALVNAVPHAVVAAPGYINTLELPSLTLFDDNVCIHIHKSKRKESIS